ncbi:cutinase [Xylariaceae sp. FL0804]|nr:cutinase [Xylariaceae sp. FL0804]
MPSSSTTRRGLGRAAAAAAVAALTAAPQLARAQNSGLSTCTDVHIFLARGNNEPYPGRQGALVDAICAQLSSCDYEDIVFDDGLGTEYCGAVAAGDSAGTSQIADYNGRCPDTKLVVSGYSEGAHVVGDVLGGGGGSFFDECTMDSTDAMDADSAPGNMIKAALMFGNVRHVASQSYNTLSGAGDNSYYPRSGDQLAALNAFADVLHDYCAGGDPICAQGETVADHLNYFQLYTDAAADWVVSMVGGATATTTSSSSSTTTTAGSASGSAGSSLSSGGAAASTSSVGQGNSTTTAASKTAASPLPEATATASNSMPSATSAAAPRLAPGGATAVGAVTGLVGMVVTLGSLVFVAL